MERLMINVVHSRRVAAAADPINLLFFFIFILKVPRLCVMAKRGQEGREIHVLVSPTSPSPSH